MSTPAPNPRQSFLFMGLAAGALTVIALFLAIQTEVITLGPATPPAHPETARFTARAAPLPFLGPFASQQSVDAALAVLERSGSEPGVSTRPRPGSTQAPPGDLTTVLVEDYAYCGTTGLLTLQFFNDRLFEAAFDAGDAQRCGAALKNAYPQLRRDANGRAEWIDGDLRIASNVWLASSEVGRTLGIAPWVLWQDRRLLAQRDEWERRFGTLRRSDG